LLAEHEPSAFPQEREIIKEPSESKETFFEKAPFDPTVSVPPFSVQSSPEVAFPATDTVPAFSPTSESLVGEVISAEQEPDSVVVVVSVEAVPVAAVSTVPVAAPVASAVAAVAHLPSAQLLLQHSSLFWQTWPVGMQAAAAADGLQIPSTQLLEQHSEFFWQLVSTAWQAPE